MMNQLLIKTFPASLFKISFQGGGPLDRTQSAYFTNLEKTQNQLK